MGTLRSLIIIAAIIQLSLASPFWDGSRKFPLRSKIPKSQSEESDTGHRLPGNIFPKEYDILLTPDMESLTYTGDVKILIERPQAEDVSTIYIHAKYLRNIEVTLTPPLDPPVEIEQDYIVKYEFLVLNLSRPLPTDVDFTLHFKYDTDLSSDMKAFFKSYYYEDGVKKWMAGTQFEPYHARKVFPCFDDPSYKAVFKISMNCPENYVCLSNMQEMSREGNLVKFYPTPKMSTYILAFAVAQFEISKEITGENPYRVWARPDYKNQGIYALDEGVKLTEKMHELTGIDFFDMAPNMKLDQIAMPEKSGAMENWGLLVYSEVLLMFDDEETNIFDKFDTITVMAHEISHQWFGNLVTCRWWSEIWLNEGFAQYFTFYLTDLVDSSYYLWDQFVVTEVQEALNYDTDVDMIPLTNPQVNSLPEIYDQFDVSYDKGAAVLRMISHLLGQEEFNEGLKRLLNNNLYGNIMDAELFAALQNDEILAEYDTTIEEVLGSFSKKSGYPLIHVSVDQDQVVLTQNRFLDFDETSDDLYNVPISYATEDNPDFENTKPAFIMKNRELRFNPSGNDGWIVLNVQQTGYYRVSYSDDLMDKLIDILKSDRRTYIHRFNRAQIVDDAFNLARYDHMDYSRMLDIIDFLSSETQYSPWGSALGGFWDLRSLFYTHYELAEKFNTHMLNLMATVIDHVGFEAEGDYIDRLTRSSVLKLACEAGHEECIAFAVRKFEDMRLNGIKVHPDIREYVYCTALRNGGADDYDFLWDSYVNSNSPSDKYTLSNVLGCSGDMGKISELLMRSLTETSEDIRESDRYGFFRSVISKNKENAEFVAQFMRENFDLIFEVMADDFSGLVRGLVGYLSDEISDEFEAFFEGLNISEDDKNSFISAFNRRRSRKAWVNSKEDDILNWLNTRYN